MKTSLESALALLHEVPHGTIATLSDQLAGYPYATVVPCVLDQGHCPVFLISALAEHTKNLLADRRSSLSVVKGEGANIQAAARITLVGDCETFEPAPEMVARYLHYHPDAEEYLSLDFMFFRLRPARARFIGGIGKMGWIESAEWDAIPAIPLKDEAALLKAATLQAPAGIRLLGVDLFGIDYEVKGVRQRQRFPDAPLPPEKLEEVLARVVSKLP
ncbi:MAG TPA: pyridoxamine 5'-phosphate oxidase family protein [Rhodocyclaceae bacterium]|nr:pyridoxamine 5'-phosphate oxidase family protein [Rhodocyclaceae bacterium]